MLHAFLPELVGLLAGLACRRRAATLLRRLIRGQMLVFVVPISLLGGLVFVFKPVDVISMAVLFSAEAVGLIAGGIWYRRSAGRIGIAHAASAPNSGMWNIPIASAFLNPTAVVYLAVYDVAAAPVNLLLTGSLRRNAPMPQAQKSGLIDYAGPVALAAGIGLQVMFGRPELSGALVRFSLVNVAVGMLMFGLAAPLERPVGTDLRVLPASVLLRWLPMSAGLTLLVVFGVHPPPAAWLIAIAPAFFGQLSFSALYGYSRRQALLIVLVTATGALALLPFVLHLAS